MAPKQITFVVGCPRSGTSPFARWLHACGLSTVSDARRHERYPAGYFEHLPVLMFHRGLERLPRGADHRITLESFLRSELLEDPYVAATFRLAFAPLLAGEVELFKYPQLALSFEFLFEQFPGCQVVALWRDPVETFRSLVRREFPHEMIPASGVKAILLWSLYAHHIVEARRRRPDAVTVVRIDGFMVDPDAGASVLERIGRPPEQAVPLSQAIDVDLWRSSKAGPFWRAYHAAMSALCRLAEGRLGAERNELADQRRWLDALLGVTDVGQPCG